MKVKRIPFANLVEVASRSCTACGAQFTPRPGGYNAAYCSRRCKRRVGRARERDAKPEQVKARRARSFKAVKARPERYDAHLGRTAKYRQVTREWLAAYKMERGCVDCGFKGHWAALQLDHEGPKSISIADARTSIARLQAEIAAGQCKVRCANCHAVKTWERKQAKLKAEGRI